MTKLIAAQAKKLFKEFHTDFLASQTGIKAVNIRNQKSRGKISAVAADAFCKIPDVKEAGFTRENLRPDIRFWGE